MTSQPSKPAAKPAAKPAEQQPKPAEQPEPGSASDIEVDPKTETWSNK